MAGGKKQVEPVPGYQVKHENISVVGVADLHIRSLLDRQQYSDPNGEAEALGVPPASWPLFGLLWPSGQILARLMAERIVTTERILELGCGLGLASLVAHRRGADITASDFHPLAASFLLENLRLNAMSALPFVRTGWQDDCTELGRFGLIIGSDVLYERDEAGVLPAFIERHAYAQAEVLIVDPDRGNRPHFNRHMSTLGFAFSDTRADCIHPDGSRYKGRILRYRR
ncbi:MULTISPECIES: methyltransferase [unclassified Uliginosibacterium]|uniref:class I SAM-dependent methyltransferase n=1 Tax=unclassified Uliginosibacterium TaxID=2621521 RepID=UPI0020B10740|nr:MULTISPECIES: methyltransferase [unclassified Uliginosibacterium]MDO6385252.1 methyltransferase [Uliginosibacterium sp. 31-12]